jgi:hypothetical protein
VFEGERHRRGAAAYVVDICGDVVVDIRDGTSSVGGRIERGAEKSHVNCPPTYLRNEFGESRTIEKILAFPSYITSIW